MGMDDGYDNQKYTDMIRHPSIHVPEVAMLSFMVLGCQHHVYKMPKYV